MKLTKAQIEAIAAKLDANGLAPGARVFDVETGEITSREQLQEKCDQLCSEVVESIDRLGAIGLGLVLHDDE